MTATVEKSPLAGLQRNLGTAEDSLARVERILNSVDGILNKLISARTRIQGGNPDAPAPSGQTHASRETVRVETVPYNPPVVTPSAPLPPTPPIPIPSAVQVVPKKPEVDDVPKIPVTKIMALIDEAVEQTMKEHGDLKLSDIQGNLQNDLVRPFIEAAVKIKLNEVYKELEGAKA